MDNIIILLDEDNMDVQMNEDNMDVQMNEVFNVVDIAGADHSKLKNLDYENSGHTGFAPISILNNITVDEETETLIIKNMEVPNNG